MLGKKNIGISKPKRSGSIILFPGSKLIASLLWQYIVLIVYFSGGKYHSCVKQVKSFSLNEI